PHILVYDAASPRIHSFPTRRSSDLLQVRLELLRYPLLIRSLFNVSRFGPPSSVTWTSAWTWVDHLVSGLQSHTKTPISDSLSLRLRIRCLTLHVITTRRFILQKARHHPLT